MKKTFLFVGIAVLIIILAGCSQTAAKNEGSETMTESKTAVSSTAKDTDTAVFVSQDDLFLLRMIISITIRQKKFQTETTAVRS